MRLQDLLWLIAVLAVMALPACHTMRFELANEPSARIIVERKSYYLWGLAPTKTVDVRQRCPHGAVAVMEETTFVDGLLSLPTLGIWEPRSSTFYCRAEAAP